MSNNPLMRFHKRVGDDLYIYDRNEIYGRNKIIIVENYFKKPSQLTSNKSQISYKWKHEGNYTLTLVIGI
jgi:hypothetical protein